MVYILVPAIVDNHLNSKSNAIYSAAIGAIDELIHNLGKFDLDTLYTEGDIFLCLLCCHLIY